MNSRTLMGTALSAALAIASVGAAAAQTVQPVPITVPPVTVPPVTGPPVAGPPVSGRPVPGRQSSSNHNIGMAANRTGRFIAMLERDERTYGGHRVNAINDLTNAHNELTSAEQFAESHGYYTQTTENPQPQPEGPRRHDRKRSNYSIGHVAEAVHKMLTHLQSDTRDYGGHRAAAINWLQQADNELSAAEQFDQTHPNG